MAGVCTWPQCGQVRVGVGGSGVFRVRFIAGSFLLIIISDSLRRRHQERWIEAAEAKQKLLREAILRSGEL